MISSSASRQSRLTSAGSVSASASAAACATAGQRRADRRAVMGRPPARTRADRAAPIGVPAEATQAVVRRTSPRRRRSVSSDGTEPEPAKQAQLEHAQSFGAGPVRVEAAEKRRQPVVDGRLDLAWCAQLAHQLGGVGGVRHRARRPSRASAWLLGRVEALQRQQLGAGALAQCSDADRAQRRGRPRSGAGSCARRAPAPTAARCRARTA